VGSKEGGAAAAGWLGAAVVGETEGADVVGGTTVVVTSGGGVGSRLESGGGLVGLVSWAPKIETSISCAAGWLTNKMSPQGETYPFE
jgi:hypothetical protein